MDEQRGGITKWLLIGVAALLFYQFGLPAITGKNSATELQPLGGLNEHLAPEGKQPDEELCRIEGPRYIAQLSSHGGALRHFELTDKKYAIDGKPIDLVTSDLRSYSLPLRTDLRPATLTPASPLKPSENLVDAKDTTQQVAYDELEYKLEAHDGKRCVFTYKDASTQITKTISAASGPFELALELKIENLSDTPKKHRLSIEMTDWRTAKDMEGHLGRQSEWMTEVVASTSKTTDRHHHNDFEPSDFKKKEFNDEKWRQTNGDAKFAAVSSVYFSRVVAPFNPDKPPRAETLVEEYWNRAEYKDRTKDPGHGYLFRARLTYPTAELAPKASVTYKAAAFNGPKERDVLAAVGNDISGVIDLGRFAVIGRALIWYLYKLYAFTHSWGIAILLLTITVRLGVFPLSIAQLKSSARMRKLKPEIDAINKRFPDMTQRGVATQELYRKHGMSQFSMLSGCLPMVLQLPVWWALYSALQTAVELYHVPFLWFPDLSAPDKLYITPIILGGTSFLQQKIMPQQGDAQQQKMMMYMMPGIFTVMMLFLPSGLGVYMFASSVVSIVQQLIVERYLRTKPETGIVVKERLSGDDDKSPPALGKGKARVRG